MRFRHPAETHRSPHVVLLVVLFLIPTIAFAGAPAGPSSAAPPSAAPSSAASSSAGPPAESPSAGEAVGGSLSPCLAGLLMILLGYGSNDFEYVGGGQALASWGCN